MTMRHKVLTGKRIRNAGTIFVGALIAGVPIAMAQDSTTIQTETTTTVQQQDPQQRATDQSQTQRQEADRLQRNADSDSAQLRAQNGELQLEADARVETSSQIQSNQRQQDQTNQRQSNQNQNQQDRAQYGAPESSDSVFTADMKDDGRQATVEGRVVNIESYLKYGREVALDRNDSRSQIQQNSPVGLLTDDGKVIVLLSRDDGGFFAESQGANDGQLRQRFTQNGQQGNLRTQDRVSNASELDAERFQYQTDAQHSGQQATPQMTQQSTQQSSPQYTQQSSPRYTQESTQQSTPRYTQESTRYTQSSDRVAPAKPVGPLHHDPVAHRGPTEDMNAARGGEGWSTSRETSRSSVQQASPQDRSSTRYSADMSQSERKWADKNWSDKDQSRQQDGSWQQDRQLSTSDIKSRSSQNVIADSSSVSLDAHQRHLRNDQGNVQYSGQIQQDQQGVQWGSADEQNRTQYRASRNDQSLQDRQSLQAGNRVSIDGRLYERQQEQGIVPQSIRLAEQANMQNQNQNQRNQQNQLNQQNLRNQQNQQNQLNQQDRSQSQINQSSQDRNQQGRTQSDTDARNSGANLNSDANRVQPARDVTQGKPQDSDLLQRRAQEAEDRARAAGENLNERATGAGAEVEVDAEVDTDGGM